jgi:hypothetical protein
VRYLKDRRLEVLMVLQEEALGKNSPRIGHGDLTNGESPNLQRKKYSRC